MKYTYSFLVLTLTFVLFSIVANAQCDSDAGQYPPDDLFICDNVISVPIPSNTFLEPNDGIDYIQFTDPLDPLNSLTRISIGRTVAPRNIYISPHIGDTAIYFAAIVGDTLPRGEVNFDDPCLSISNSFKIIVSDLECSVEVIETVGCFTTESTLIANVSGGTPPHYEFLWNSGHEDDTIKVFGVGAFGVTVVDTEGCSTECVGFISEPVPFEVLVDIFCQGDSIPMFLNGVPPFNGYVIPTTVDAVVLDTMFFDSVFQKMNPLSPDFISFDYNFTDKLGCDTEGTIQLPQDPLTCVINQSADSLDCDNPSITLEILGTGGNPPYSYSWNNGLNSSSISTTVPGTFSVTVTDDAGCGTVCSATVIDNIKSDLACTLPSVNIICSDPVSCIDAIPSGGQSPYTYEWSDDSGWSNGHTVQTLCVVNPGTYTLTITDDTGCKSICSTFVNVDNSTDLVCTIPPPVDLDCNNPTACIEPVVTGGVLPYSYFWSNGQTVPTICVTDSGTYSVTVVGANGCATVCDAVVNGNTFDVVVDILCGGDSIPMFLDGVPPFNGYVIPTTASGTLDTIYYNDILTRMNPLSPNILYFDYNFSDGSGCNIEGTIDDLPEGILTCFLDISDDTLSCLVTESYLEIVCTGGSPPYLYNINGVFNQVGFLTIDQPGIYEVTVTDSRNCTRSESFFIGYDDSDCGSITGTVLLDQEDDCQVTPTDTPLDCWIVQASNLTNTFFATTQPDGSYVLPVAPGTYDVEIVGQSPYFDICGGSQQITVVDANDVANADFLALDIFKCALMEVQIGSYRPRVCFDDVLYLEYCNKGTVAADDVFIKLNLDSILEIQSADFPYTFLGDTIIFELGTVQPGDCGLIKVTYLTSCDAVIGQTPCVEAIISPNDPCPPASPLWSGASLAINAECVGDSIHFTIKNVGNGTMTQAREYIVIEDAAIMRVSNPFTLGAGGERTGSIATTGSTIRIEVEQEENHPGQSMPSITIERCGTGPFSTGFVNQLPLDDADIFVDIECQPVRTSYDPNDKRAEPSGFSTEHFIEPNTDLEYTIRFQNTGNDTAFTVELIDTISQFLNVGSVTPGISSHDYRFEVFETGILRFTFNDILLVDSFTNEPASNGFVKYSIAQKGDVALGSVIYNAADIYFDFNAPIYTNQTFHTVGRDFITVKTQEVFVPGAIVNVYPNPFNDKATFELQNVAEGQKTLRLLDISGKIVYSQTVFNKQFILDRKNLNGGFYFYEISNEGAKIATGKLVVE